MSMPATPTAYPARLDVDYSDEHNRVTTLFRLVLVIPIAIVYGALTAGATKTVYDEQRSDGDQHAAVGSPPACSSRRC